MKTDLDALGLTILVVGCLGASLLVPDLSIALLLDPGFGGILGMMIVLPLVVVLRAKGRRGSLLERRVWALFLALMPTVYLTALLRRGGEGRSLGIELFGQVLFAAAALLGLRRSPWFLALGVAAHGLAWDAWHYHRSAYMSDWYSIACLVVDVAAGIYLGTQVRAFRQQAT